ncbi:hypothetical protein [uncultured Roseobacter sp.]|uniref:hypothetical protein n=1 Tax=uncultured Roseobacter sp. TaxID=114847 RepID=UPI0026359B44|nr:hypothetical protein [uncultured Roseobacter sp.]
MPLSTEHAVRETYRLALEQNLVKHLKTQAEFDQYHEIRAEAAQRIDAEKDAFRANYHQRLEVAREMILREHNSRTLDHPKPDWAVETPPSADKVDLLARNRVQTDHEKRLAVIRVDQTDQYEDLRQVCRARETRETQERTEHARAVRQDHAKETFNLTNELSPHEAQTRGRSGPSRS